MYTYKTQTESCALVNDGIFFPLLNFMFSSFGGIILGYSSLH